MLSAWTKQVNCQSGFAPTVLLSTSMALAVSRNFTVAKPPRNSVRVNAKFNITVGCNYWKGLLLLSRLIFHQWSRNQAACLSDLRLQTARYQKLCFAMHSNNIVITHTTTAGLLTWRLSKCPSSSASANRQASLAASNNLAMHYMN